MLHLADLHINTSTHDVLEYTALFKRINKVARQITVLCGDVFDTRVVSATDISVFVLLVSTINTPLIIIPGNHDRSARKPAGCYIASILSTYPHEPIAPFAPHSLVSAGTQYTLPNTRVYFAHRTACFDISPHVSHPTLVHALGLDASPSTAPVPHYCNVGLMHDAKIPAQVIHAYDIVMAGDIHVRRFVDVAGHAAYAGSPIQIHVGEPNAAKGGILWDVQTRVGTPVNFKNKYGYAQYDDTTIHANYTLPQLPYEIRIYSDDPDIHAKLDALDVPACVAGRSVRNVIRSAETIAATSALAAANMPDVAHECRRRQDALQTQSAPRQPIQFGYLEFVNVRSYTAPSHINFTNLAGIVGLVGSNMAGKTSIIYALCLALYGKPPRGTIRQTLTTGTATTRIDFVSGDAYSVRRSYRDYRQEGYSLEKNGTAVDVATAADMNKAIVAVVGPMCHLMATQTSIDILDEFALLPQADQADIVLAMYGYADWSVWRATLAAECRTIKKQQQAIQAQIKPSKTADRQALLAAAVDAQRVADMADLQMLRQYNCQKHCGVPRAERCKPDRPLHVLKTSLHSPDSVSIRVAQHALERSRGRDARAEDLQAQLPELTEARHIAETHLALVNELPRAQFARFIAEAQSTANAMLAHLPISVAFVHEDDKFAISVVSGRLSMPIESASGFEYTVASLAVRAAILRIFGHTFMFIDDYYSRIDAGHVADFMRLLANISAHVKTVMLVTHVAEIHARVAERVDVRSGQLAIGESAAVADTTQDSRGNVIFNDAAAYRPVEGGYICLRCVKPKFVKRTNGPHNKKHRT